MRFCSRGSVCRIARTMLLVIGVALAILFPTGTPPAIAAATPFNLFDRSELAAFVDPYVTKSMASAHVPGAVAIFVKDGTVLYSRGYGVANLDRQTPVEPQTTLFRVASVSKILTTTAVMQLADRGKLQLDSDVNQYLQRFQVPETYPQPVTLSQLLTHTAGFEDRTMRIATLNASDLPSLRSYVATRMPKRVNPPGVLYGYSNYSFALAGYIVEAVSGQPFDRYMAEQVFQPLGMAHTSFRQPLPENLTGSLATGYDVVDKTPNPAPFEYFADAPADALSTTAADMAQFMIAQLGDGPNADRVLSESARTRMQQLHYQAVSGAEFSGMAYGYERYSRNGVLILSKEGDIRGFASYLSLLPDQHFGFFIAANTNDSGWMRDLERRLVNRAYPRPPAAPPVTPPSLRGSLSKFVGSYIPNRSSRSTVEKLRVLTQQLRITDAGNGILRVNYPDDGSIRLTRIAPMIFASVADGVIYRWPFLTNSDGRVEYFLMGNDVYERVPWYATRSVQEVMVLAFVLLFLVGLGVWLVPALVLQIRRWRGRASAHSRRSWLACLVRPLGGAIFGLNLIFIVSLAAVLITATATQDLGYSWITYGTPLVLYVLLCLPLLTITATVALAASAAVAWRTHAWSRQEYGYCALALVVEVAFIPYLNYWNLIGFRV